MSNGRRFEFAFDERFRPLLRVIGVTPEHAEVRLTDDGRLTGRFGRWSFDTPTANIASAKASGGYRWYRVIGPRGSLTDGGCTFGSNSRAGACIRFHEPVPILYGKLIPNTAITVTVADPEGLVAALCGHT